MNPSSEMYRALAESYPERTTDRSAFQPAWEKFAEAFPPSLSSIYAIDGFPSFQLARYAGDLGFAVLWIVQAALIRAIISTIRSQTRPFPQSLNAVDPARIGSLAHSEDNNNPVTAIIKSDCVEITGVKKYITGGIHSDFIFLTARKPGEEKVSLLMHIPVHLLPEGALQEISIGTLKTTSHASLTLRNLELQKASVIPLEPAVIRKILKIQGMLERSLIMQSFIGLLMYVVDNAPGLRNSLRGELEASLNSHNTALALQIDAANTGNALVSPKLDINSLLAIVGSLKQFIEENPGSVSQALLLRFNDLDLFSRLG